MGIPESRGREAHIEIQLTAHPRGKCNIKKSWREASLQGQKGSATQNPSSNVTLMEKEAQKQRKWYWA